MLTQDIQGSLRFQRNYQLPLYTRHCIILHQSHLSSRSQYTPRARIAIAFAALRHINQTAITHVPPYFLLASSRDRSSGDLGRIPELCTRNLVLGFIFHFVVVAVIVKIHCDLVFDCYFIDTYTTLSSPANTGIDNGHPANTSTSD